MISKIKIESFSLIDQIVLNLDGFLSVFLLIDFLTSRK